MTNPLLAQFVAEAADLLAEVDEGLLRLERDPADVDLVNAVFRAAHTFKGSSGLFDLPELTRLTHAAEDLLDAVRSGALPLDAEMVDGLLAAFDAVRAWIPVIEATGSAPASAAATGEAIARRLRTALGDDAGGSSPVTVTVAATPVAPTVLAPWVLDLGEETLRGLLPWLEATGASIRALDYRPDDGCFFRGEDPLHLVRQVPALEVLEVRAPDDLPAVTEFDEYESVLRFTALTRAAMQEVQYVFRYVPNQVEVVEVTAAALARLLDGGDEAEAPTEAEAPEEHRVLVGLLAAQRRVLAAGVPTPASVTAAVRVALRAASALGLSVTSPAEGAGPEAVLAWVDALVAAAGSPVVPAQRTAPVDEQDAGAERSADGPVGEPATEDATAGSRILKIEQSKVDRLLDLVGELVVAKNSLPFVAAAAEEEGHRVLARRIKDEYAVVSRVSEELQQAVMDVRMLPVSTAFARAPRLVRDLSRKLGKRVRLVQEGEETAADKDVIEMLAEPLVHLVRNSLDHGIEPPEERVAAGKPEEATLLLRAVPDGDAVLVEVADDGRGIDVERVRRKAYERGIVEESALESMSDAQIAELIFAPGFSTADQVSDVSGRGVGMDAVRSAIERLGGTVTTDSRPGQGLTIRLRLPLTMAVSRVLLITAGGQRFGVPIDDVVETVRTPWSSVTRVAGREVLVLRDEIVPLAPLAGLLDLPAADRGDEVSVLVVRTATGPLGVVVDRFHQNTDVILKPLDGLLAGTPGYCGTALLGDGLVLLVLDVKELNNRAAAAR
ncbi:chemotaxis protein CheA [Motilibacter sp. E257]|uniref:histidine kinase n=1 Tax=Motilibacter deserti TaxID=2714956 RepID=A0ABX0GWD1_9ACTN|nr:chemotaxis protein CheA [Motilibacter deserti]